MIVSTPLHLHLVHNERTFLRLQRRHYARSLADVYFRMREAHTASFMVAALVAPVLTQLLLPSGPGFLVVPATPGMEHGVN